MTDRPMIFSRPMICALREGRKTQTRRVLKPQFPEWVRAAGFSMFTPPGSISGRGNYIDDTGYDHGPAEKFIKLPILKSDRLWVRESGVQLGNAVASGKDHDDYEVCGFRYAADDTTIYLPGMFEGHDYERRRNSIHMPRWASRLTLTVTDVRVERLQDISEEDARAEGVTDDCDPFWRPSYSDPDSGGNPSHRGSYEWLWDSINGPGSWEANPWVAAYTFTVQHGNIDSLPRVAA